MESFLYGSSDNERGSGQRGTLCRLTAHQKLTVVRPPIEGICPAATPSRDCEDGRGRNACHRSLGVIFSLGLAQISLGDTAIRLPALALTTFLALLGDWLDRAAHAMA